MGDLATQMANGIDGSSCCVVFVTERYMSKVASLGEDGDDDNCKFEVRLSLVALAALTILCRHPRALNQLHTPSHTLPHPPTPTIAGRHSGYIGTPHNRRKTFGVHWHAP